MTAATSTYLTRRLLPATWRQMRKSMLHAAVRGAVSIAYRLRTTNLEQIPEGPAVLVCNHVSFADAVIIGGALRRPVRFVMDHRRYAGRLRGLLDAAGVIPIARSKDDPRRLQRAYDDIAAALRRGELVCIFPEGMVTRDGQLNRFRDGVVRIVERTPVPVVPLALRGMWGSYFSHHGGPVMSGVPRRFRSKIELCAGRPLAPAGVSAAALRAEVESLLTGDE